MKPNAAAARQVGKQHIAVLLKEQEKDAAQGIAVKPVKKFQGNQTANAQPQDGTLEIGLTKWRRP